MYRPFAYAATAVVAVVVGSCISPSPPTEATSRQWEPLPIGVSPESLWRTPDAWEGKPIRCLLVSDTYTVSAAGVCWHDRQPPAGLPAIVFELPPAKLPKRSDASIEIIGTCRGRNGGSVVIVSDCTVTTIPTRLF